MPAEVSSCATSSTLPAEVPTQEQTPGAHVLDSEIGDPDPETSARCLTNSSSASSPASLLLCAHPQSAQSLVLPQSAQSLVLPQSVLSHAPLIHASRSVLLCNLLHPASRSAHPRASECFSSHQDQQKRRKSVSHASTETLLSHFKSYHGCRRIFSTLHPV
ncbi:Putative small proline-rich protein 2J [Lemmus lemmus]